MIERSPRPRATGRARRGTNAVAARIEDEVRITAAELIDSVAEARLKAAAVRFKVEDEVRQTAGKLRSRVTRVADEARERFGDDARFLKSWIDAPLRTGSVTPSSPFLAKQMAAYVDPAEPGPVVEIGPGTGPVTEALIERGVAEERLVLVEYSAEFCALLAARFPRATVVQGDAYALAETLAGHLPEPAMAIVSSLPLFTRPPTERRSLVQQAFALARPGAPFIQFTYSVVSPVPRKGAGLRSTVSDWVLRNIPPARVWVYRKT